VKALETKVEVGDETFDRMRILKNTQATDKRKLKRKVEALEKKQIKSHKPGALSRLQPQDQETIEKYKMDAVKAMEAKEEALLEMKNEGMLSLLSVHQRGQAHSGEMMEFCLKLMSRSLSAPQAVDVLRDVMSSAYPNLVDKVDYQIPSPSSFTMYRKCLYSIANNRMVHAINEADGCFLSHGSLESGCTRISILIL
jgi:hypothetical protein